MKYLMIRVPIFALLIFTLISTHSVWAQNDIGYWAHKPMLPVEVESFYINDFALTTDVAGNADYALVVGISDRTDRQDSPFIYDHFGFIDPDSTFADRDPGNPLYDPNPNDPIPGKFWDLEELVGLPAVPGYPLYDQGIFRGVNSSGLVCGYFAASSLSGEPRLPVYLDLTDPVLQLKLVPLPLDYSEYAGISSKVQVNDAGDILVNLTEVDGGPRQFFLFNPLSETGVEVPAQLTGYYLNSSRQIVGTLDGTQDGQVARHTVGGSTELFQDISRPKAINENGQFVASLIIRRGPDKGFYAVRIGADGIEERRWETTVYPLWGTHVDDINESGDAFGEIFGGGYYYHEGDPGFEGDEILYDNLLNLVIPESDPGGDFCKSGLSNLGMLSNRDSTGFGWIATDSYTGVNADGSSRSELYLLIPVIPGQTPGIFVNPTSGLTTTEARGQATFDIVLNSEPSDDVTIGISTSDTSEGTADVNSVTFTPANWDEIQTVTVTGADDPDIDGDIGYTIITAAATSADPDYNGLDADDVQVTNLDNEQPPGGSTVEYESGTLGLTIWDNDPAGISSTITNVPDHDPLGLTVTLNIDHPRPADLEAFVTGPDGISRELFNIPGDNDLTGMITDTDGDWLLEVFDIKKRKEGTLQSWSITVDY